MKTKNKIVILVTICFTLFIQYIKAQQQIPKAKRFGLDASALGISAFGLYQFKGTYLLNPNSNFKREIGLGAFILPESDAKNRKAFNNDGLYSAKLISVSLRQYFWKGLNLEQGINFGQSKLTNNVVDGKDYSTFNIQSHSLIGYKFNLLKRKAVTFFLIAQGGIIYSYQPNKWPVLEKEPVYGLGDIKLGINF
jgi:hypothetical protein